MAQPAKSEYLHNLGTILSTPSGRAITQTTHHPQPLPQVAANDLKLGAGWLKYPRPVLRGPRGKPPGLLTELADPPDCLLFSIFFDFPCRPVWCPEKRRCGLAARRTMRWNGSRHFELRATLQMGCRCGFQDYTLFCGPVQRFVMRICTLAKKLTRNIF